MIDPDTWSGVPYERFSWCLPLDGYQSFFFYPESYGRAEEKEEKMKLPEVLRAVL